MCDDDWLNVGKGFVAGLLVGILGISVTIYVVNDKWKTNAVEAGHAEYSRTSGEWIWRDVTRKPD